jgi:hypothetical protein
MPVPSHTRAVVVLLLLLPAPPVPCCVRVVCPQEEATATTSSTAAQQQEQPSTSGRKLTTAEWRAKYEKDGAVDLFLVDQFNAAMVVSLQHCANNSSSSSNLDRE